MPKKIHTRVKRKFKLPTHKTGKVTKRKKRLKTFKSEESAKKWAESTGINDYELVNIRSEFSKDKKIRVIVK